MSWTFDRSNTLLPVVKQNGKCVRESMHKFCPYWIARHSVEDKKEIYQYRCSLFDKTKNGYDAIYECNAKYGLNYDGPP